MNINTSSLLRKIKEQIPFMSSKNNQEKALKGLLEMVLDNLECLQEADAGDIVKNSDHKRVACLLEHLAMANSHLEKAYHHGIKRENVKTHMV